MTFNAASRLRALEDRSAALGSSRCELPGMHSVPKSAVLPYASGVGGLSRRLLNKSKRKIINNNNNTNSKRNNNTSSSNSNSIITIILVVRL